MTRALSILRLLYSIGLAAGLCRLLTLGVLGVVGGLLPTLDLVNHFQPWLLLMGLVALPVLWPAGPTWRLLLAGLAGLCLLLQASFVLPTALASPVEAEQEA